MSSGSKFSSEVRDLAGAMFDGTITAPEVERLDELIVNDSTCLQAYVEMVNLHADLLARADFRADRQAVLSTLQQYSATCELRESRRRRRDLVLIVAAGSLVCSLIGWMFFGDFIQPVPLGSIAHMTEGALLKDGSFEPGQVLREGGILQVENGIVSVQLEHVLVDILGPARVQLEKADRIRLESGSLVAQVDSGGEGFTVRTPDANVVDLGTEFYVQYRPETGTDLSVRRGRARGTLLDVHGNPAKVLDVTAGRGARFQQHSSVLEESEYQSAGFKRVERSRGSIRVTSGQLRTPSHVPESLVSEELTTPEFMLVIPEQQAVVLESDLTVKSLTKETVIPAGTRLSSYLVHYDPTELASFAPRGSVTFFGKIAATVTMTGELIATDPLFALPGVTYDTRAYRGLELDADEVRISDDGRTLSFFFGMAPPRYLDQVRILVHAE